MTRITCDYCGRVATGNLETCKGCGAPLCEGLRSGLDTPGPVWVHRSNAEAVEAMGITWYEPASYMLITHGEYQS